MHERSLVRSLIGQIVEEMQLRGIERIVAVQLQIGAFSGVEPALVELAFVDEAARTWDGTVRLNLEVVPLTAMCRSCGATFRVEQFRFVCPECGAGHVEVTAGEELRLVSLSAARQTVGGGSLSVGGSRLPVPSPPSSGERGQETTATNQRPPSS